MGDRGDLADRLLGPRRRRFHSGGVDLTHHHEEREQHDAEQRHKRVNDEQGDDSNDHQGQHTHRKRQRLEHHRCRGEVDVGVGEQFTGRPIAMESQRHIEVVVDERPPPVALGAVLGKREIPPPHHHADATTHRHHDDQTHDDPDIGPVDRAVIERRDDEVVGSGPKDPCPAD